MTQNNKLSRRRFLTLGCGALCAAALAGGCANQASKSDSTTSCPFGEVNDPYPGRCHRYTDQNGTGICDYSEVGVAASPTATPIAEVKVRATGAADLSASARTATRCPKGLVNDPYPGRCHSYTDRNGSGICDLSESA
ncbi:MAG: hypothetical protein JW934_03175 [Anaerolineae bacterium]|nr:hypothetical protein [Anaerolineae bacterium]